jgi:hypothetical protein
MIAWPLVRRWTLLRGSVREDVTTPDLAEYPACCLLGGAGLGKTYELATLADLERRTGHEVRIDRLASLAQTAESLESRLNRVSTNATNATVIYLDALDEVMVPVRAAGTIVTAWIRESLKGRGIRLRISCRSAVFPENVRSALIDVFGEEYVALSWLQALNDDDVRHVATAMNIDATAFAAAIDRGGVTALAQQPLTLKMLLDVFRRDRELPTNRAELFRRGIRELASERYERRESGTASTLATDDIIEASERLACISLLSGSESIDYGPEASLTDLSVDRLAGLTSGSARTLDHEMLRAIRLSGLAEAEAPTRFRFGHRQYAEYLAGRRLARLLPHQAISLLSSSLGSDAGVAGPLRETAAFAAIESHEVAQWVAATDPEVIGLSDVADQRLRQLATMAILDRLRKHELTDAQLWREGIELRGLQYDGAARDLAIVLRKRPAETDDVLEGVVQMVASWQLSQLSDELADVVLEPMFAMHLRASAAYTLTQVGTAASRERLKVLTIGTSDDVDDELKGFALRCTYPAFVKTSELLDVLTAPKRKFFSGAYSSFLSWLDRSGFAAAGDLVRGLTWAHRMLPNTGREFDSDPLARIRRRVARAAVEHLEEPAIAAGLCNLLTAAAERYLNSPLSPPTVDSAHPIDSRPIRDWDDVTRRRLVDVIVERVASDQIAFSIFHRPADLLHPTDLDWLLARAADTTLTMQHRERYADVARYVPWEDEDQGVEAWLRVRNEEPFASRVPFLTVTWLDGADAAWRKADYLEKREARSRPTIDVASEIQKALDRVSSGEHRRFLQIAYLLRIDSSRQDRVEFERFLTHTPGWSTLEGATRDSIVAAAKQLLTHEREEPTHYERSWTSIRVGFMEAVWLVQEVDPAWLEAQPLSWWQLWGSYILQELHPNLSGESEEPKRDLLHRLHRAASDIVRETLVELGGADGAEHTLNRLLNMVEDIADGILDQALTARG